MKGRDWEKEEGSFSQPWLPLISLQELHEKKESFPSWNFINGCIQRVEMI